MVAAIIIAGGLFVGYPYYKDYLPFELEDIFGEEEVTTYAIEVVADGNGVTFGTGTYAEGEEYAIFAVADEGYVFIQWDDGNKDAERAMTASSDATHTAQFAKGYMVVLKSDTEDAAAFTGYGGYIVGDKATITVSANYGYEFISWSDGSTDTTRTLTVNSDIILTASFKTLPSATVVVVQNYEAGGVITGTGKLIIGDSRDLVATPNYGYKFLGWYDADDKLLTESSTYSVTAVTDGAVMTYYVDYLKESYTVAVTPETSDSCSVSGAKEYYPDETATIIITALEGYSYAGLYNGSTLLTSESTYTFTVTEDVSYTVRTTVVRDASFTITSVDLDGYNTLTITGKNNPDMVSTKWTITDTIFGDKITDCVGRSFTLDIEDGTAVSITYTLTYGDGKALTSTQTAYADATEVRSIEWRYQNESWFNEIFTGINNKSDDVEYEVSFADYFELFESNNGTSSFTNISKFVTPENDLVKYLADYFNTKTSDDSDNVRINYVLKFVQSFTYEYDIDSVYNQTEYWKYPYQALYDMKGDCEDTSFLFASIIEAMRYDCAIFTVDADNSGNVNHIAVGVAGDGLSGNYIEVDGTKYYYCETAYEGTTGVVNGGNVGEMNEEYTVIKTYDV